MKRTLSLLLFICILCITALAVTNDDTLYWSAKDATPDHTTVNGYPRFAQRADGTLLLTTDSGHISYSTDKGATWTKASQALVPSSAPTEKTTDITTHLLSRANFQPFVLPDGTVLLAYRCHTKGYIAKNADGTETGNEFYTSIRVMTSTDGGMTFDNEKILVEATAKREDGFWEPFMIMLDDDTVAMYYADDLNVLAPNAHAKQRIAFLTYTISTGTWSTEPQVAINRDPMTTRDGMPTITALKDGGFAMVTESQDYAEWIGDNKSLGIHCTFVVGLSLSADGITWSDPIPVVAPEDLTARILCASPSIATLPDGRVIITCQTDATYSGYPGASDSYGRSIAVAISDAPLTLNTVLTKTTGGAADGFTMLEDVFPLVENRFQIWNTVSCFGNDVYLAGTSSLNAEDGTRSDSRIRVRHALAFANSSDAAMYFDVANRTDSFAVVEGVSENGTVALTVPATVSGDLHVYRMKNGFLTKMDATVTNDVITFASTDTGFYAIAAKELVTIGDANKDGDIGLIDVLRIIHHLVGDTVNIDLSAADIDGNAEMSIEDVLQILKLLLN